MIGTFSRWSSLFVSVKRITHQLTSHIRNFSCFSIVGYLAIFIKRHSDQNIWRTKA